MFLALTTSHQSVQVGKIEEKEPFFTDTIPEILILMIHHYKPSITTYFFAPQILLVKQQAGTTLLAAR